MAYLADYNTEKQYQATVIRTKRLTPEGSEEIREMTLEVAQPSFECDVDQSFGVLVKSDGEFGNTYHHRLYSIADLPAKENGKTQITLLVKRCAFIDAFNGELYQGIGSNYLCDRAEGDQITITGPFALPFKVPKDKTANLILIGMGTGIAPFRAFVKHIYKNVQDWQGTIKLFYGAKSGLELLYLNDKDGDLTHYYDQETFEAFHALSPRPHWDAPIELGASLEAQKEMLKGLLNQTNTYIYIAGYKKVKENLDKAFASILGSAEHWETRKAELVAGKKWAEVIY